MPLGIDARRLVEGYRVLARRICRPPRSKGHFIPRTGVVERLVSLLERGVVPVVYGPRGAGKTTLLRCLAQVSAKLGVRAVYIGLHVVPPLLLGEVPPRAQQMAERLVELSGPARGSRIAQIARLVGEGGVLIIDDFDLGLDDVGSSLLARALYEYRSAGDGFASIILASSEARLANALHSLLVGDIVPALLWHMEREEHEELARLLGSPLDPRTIYEEYTGGSPDALVSLAEHGWSVEEWLEYRIRPRVEAALAELRELGVYIDTLDPDKLAARRTTRHVLLRHNLLVPLAGYRLSRVERDSWIGARWAWQLPAYHRLMARLSRAE